LARNRMLTIEIQNLILTITLAKFGIVNPTILNHADLNSLVKQDTPIVSLIEASKIRVLQSDDIIHILIAFPRAEARCKKITIYPVSHNHTILRLDENSLAECEKDTFAVTECTQTTHNSFCERARRESCATLLYSGRMAQCHTQPSHLKEIMLVDHGVLIINVATARIRTDDSPEVIARGTHLVTFERVAIVNGTEFVNEQKAMNKIPGIVNT